MRRFGYSKGIEQPQANKSRRVAPLFDAKIRLNQSDACWRSTGKCQEYIPAHRGFTLIELMMVIAIIGILTALALGSYFTYVIRSQTAQTLSSYYNIRIVVNIETQASGRVDLQLNSIPGEVPPALATLLDRVDFNQAHSTTLQLVRAPAGTFAGFPTEDVYALIATTHNETMGQYFLRVLRMVLPHSEGDKLWLSKNVLYFPLDLGSGGTSIAPGLPEPITPTVPPIPPTPPSTGDNTPGWNDTQTENNGSTWDAQSRVCLAGSDGKLLSSDLNAQVQVRIVQEVRTWDGKTTERSWQTQVPIVNGCATISQTDSPIAGSGTEGVSGLRFEIVDIKYYWPTDPAIKWDGKTPPLHITAPT